MMKEFILFTTRDFNLKSSYTEKRMHTVMLVKPWNSIKMVSSIIPKETTGV